MTENEENTENLLDNISNDDDLELYKDYRRLVEEINRRVISKLKKVSFFCCIFMIIELFGGLFSGSLAILTDSAHLFSDLCGFLISIVGLKIATRPASFELTYGYHRAEVVGALASVFIIWVLTIWLMVQASNNLLNPLPISGFSMVFFSIFNLFSNIVISKIVQNEDIAISQENREFIHSELNESAISVKSTKIYMLTDIFQSIVVILIAIIIFIYQDSYFRVVILDSIFTLISSLIVILTTIPITRDCVHVLMEASPKEVNIGGLTEELGEVIGVVDIHDVHLWSISMGKPMISLHVTSNTPQKTLEHATLICKKYGIYHITIQVEDFTQRRRPSFMKCNHRVENSIH